MNHDLIPMFGMLTGVITTGLFFWCVVQVARSEIGQALARRIQGRHGTIDSEMAADFGALRDHVLDLERQLGETQERLDFTERLLSRGSASPPGAI